MYSERYNHVLGCDTQDGGSKGDKNLLHMAEMWKRRLSVPQPDAKKDRREAHAARMCAGADT